MAEEFMIPEMQAMCTYEPKWVPETHVPVGVNKYVDYLYSLSDSHSYNLTQKNYRRFLYATRSFKLKQVRNLVEVKRGKATFVEIIKNPHCMYPFFQGEHLLGNISEMFYVIVCISFFLKGVFSK